MANTVIRLKKSSVASHLPNPVQLDYGELALNYADGKIFYKDTNDNIQQISGSANSFYTINANGTYLVATSPTDILNINAGDNIGITGDFLTDTFTISANLKSVYDVANAAFDTANNVAPQIAPTRDALNVAFQVANSAFDYANGLSSLEAASFDVANAAFEKANNFSVNIGPVPPAVSVAGNLWWDTLSGRMFIYYTDIDSSQWVETSPSGGQVDYPSVASNVAPLIVPYFMAPYDTANAAYGSVNTAFLTVNSAYDMANANYAVTNAAYNTVNTAFQNSASAIIIGDSGILSSNVNTTGTSDQIIDFFSSSDWRSANYVVTMNSGSEYHTTQISVLHNGSNAFMTEYGILYSNNNLGTFTVSMGGGYVALNVVPTFSGTTIRMLRTTNK
jgi:hypothetical protein